MFYNTWNITLTKEGTIEKRLDTSDTHERVSKKVYNPVFIGTRAFIHFPRVDEKTNQKYLKKLLKVWEKELDKLVCEFSEQMLIVSTALENLEKEK